MHQLAAEDLLRGSARFVAQDTVALSDGRRVQARAFIVATGSAAIKPAALQTALGDALITTDELFYLPELPRSVAVMGAPLSSVIFAETVTASALRGICGRC